MQSSEGSNDYMAKDREVRLRAQKKYDEAHKDDYKAYYFKCNKSTEAEIIDWLDAMPNKQGYIKQLIRDDMRSGK